MSKVTGTRKVKAAAAAAAGTTVLSGIFGGQPAADGQLVAAGLQTSVLRIAEFEKTVSVRAFVDSSFVESYVSNPRISQLWRVSVDSLLHSPLTASSREAY
jgi:hypothetical protein